MRRIALTLFGTLALLLSFGASVSAQDTYNCGDFISQAAAQSVYLADTSDPNNLDGSPENGQACDSHDYVNNAGTNPGLLGEGVPDPTAPTTGDTNTDDDVVAELPATGTGPMIDAGVSGASLLAGSAALLAGAWLMVRRASIERA